MLSLCRGVSVYTDCETKEVTLSSYPICGENGEINDERKIEQKRGATRAPRVVVSGNRIREPSRYRIDQQWSMAIDKCWFDYYVIPSGLFWSPEALVLPPPAIARS